MEETFGFTYASPTYYERLGKTPIHSNSYMEILRSVLSPEWTTFRSDLWMEARPPRVNIPNQGFKLHLSSTLEDGEAMLRVVLPILVRTETYFKIIADVALHRLVNSKRFPRPSSGKFITIYPADISMLVQLAEEIASATRKFRGPYILSDQRYKDSKVVFYRYGGFKRMSEVQLDGTRQLLIRNSDGTLAPDNRTPFFQLPPDVADPFADHTNGHGSEDQGGDLLNGRYRVEEALNFTATGGVYRAIDTRTEEMVVIKEARPDMVMVAVASAARDAIQSLEQERHGLELLQGLPCVPRLVDSFVEWEHHFLVQSFVVGSLMASLRAQDDFIIMQKMYDAQALRQSCAAWRDIGIRLLESLKLVHDRGVLLGDLSPVNVLRHPETGELTFIDLESACLADAQDDVATFSAGWAYPGFRAQQRPVKRLTRNDDYYAAGMLLYNVICPIHNIFDLDKTMPRDRFLDHFVEGGLPAEMASVIRTLWEGDAAGALAQLHAFSPEKSIADLRKSPLCSSVKKESETTARANEWQQELSSAVKQLAQNILASTDLSREDRLWPADSNVFETNALSLCHGACGVALFLQDALGELPEHVVAWLLKHKIDPSYYPPGLYTGSAGIAYAFGCFGWKDQALSILRAIPGSPLAFRSPALFDGVAGWGLAALALFSIKQDEEFLAISEEAGKFLLQSKRDAPEGLYWTIDPSEPQKLAMAYGATGIGLFLLNLWKATRNDAYLQAAKGAMEFEIAHAENENDGALLWGPTIGARVHSPYWLNGCGGVASALVRFYQALGDKRYLELAKRAALPCAGFFSIGPHLHEGLASMGETLLDMYQATGEQAYFNAALFKARQTLLFKIDQPDGIAFPGRHLLRISHDYATGGAGIGLFFHRLVHKTPRKLHDLFP